MRGHQGSALSGRVRPGIGLVYGEEQARDQAWVETRFRSRARLRSTKSWLVVSELSSTPLELLELRQIPTGPKSP
jgi:hypothetical protein